MVVFIIQMTHLASKKIALKRFKSGPNTQILFKYLQNCYIINKLRKAMEELAVCGKILYVKKIDACRKIK